MRPGSSTARGVSQRGNTMRGCAASSATTMRTVWTRGASSWYGGGGRVLDRARLDYVPDVGEGSGIVGRGTGGRTRTHASGTRTRTRQMVSA